MSSVHLLNQPVVLDLGSGLTKGGYAGTPEPSVIVGTICGTTRLPKVLPTSGGSEPSNSYSANGHHSMRLGDSVSSTAKPKSTTPTALRTPTSFQTTPGASSIAGAAGAGGVGDGGGGNKGRSAGYIVGNEIHRLSGILSIEHPIRHGIVEDWDGVEQIYRHITHDLLSVTPGEHPYLITEAALNPRPNREKLAQFFFEGLGAPALHISIPEPLSLFACGRTSGIVLNVGEGVTTAIPIAQGHCDIHALQRVDFAGRDITDRMLTLLRKSGSSLFTTSSEWQAVRRLKEKLGYVAINPSEEESRRSTVVASSFQLPDGNIIRVTAERFRAPEILFQPDIVGREFGGVHKMIASAISNVDIGLRRNMYSNILLAGGSTKFKGFGKRLLEEIRMIAPMDSKVKVIAPPDRLTSAFTGGTILASLSTTFRSVAITRQEYFEKGSSVIHSKTL